jgi:hypothetical protein
MFFDQMPTWSIVFQASDSEKSTPYLTNNSAEPFRRTGRRLPGASLTELRPNGIIVFHLSHREAYRDIGNRTLDSQS